MKKFKTFDEYCASRMVRERVERNEMHDPAGGRMYFAYGSNLSVKSMASRCPGAVKIGPQILKNGRLVFRGVADLASRNIPANSKIPGGIWFITPEHEETLDRYEGVASRLYFKRYFPLGIKGIERPVQCLYYQMSERRGVMPPSEDYYNTILEGYRNFGLPEEALYKALNESWERKNVTPMLRTRAKRRGGKLAARLPSSPPILKNELTPETLTEGNA